MVVLPVIMSGGSGTRLWPASTDARPKQFHALGSSDTMLQETADRVKAEGFLDPLIICNHRHGDQVAEQLGEIGITAAGVILEPFGRNTASVGVIAAEWARCNRPDALVLLMPADHVVADAAGFRAAVAHAAEAAKDRIVTFGITPTGPETGYGYIQASRPIYDRLFEVKRFVEKPKKEVAETYLTEGSYSWNAGIFLYDPARFLDEARRLCPPVVEAAVAAFDAASEIDTGMLLNPDLFRACPSEPIDVAVMEKTDKAAVMPISVGWADVGSWSELWRLGDKDHAHNHAKGDVVLVDASHTLAWSDGPSISVVGLSDIVVVATEEHVLVLAKDRAQEVKTVVEQRKAKS